MENQVEEQLDVTQIGKEAIAERKAEKSGVEGKKPWEISFEKDHADLAVKAVEVKEEIEEEVKEVEEKPDSKEQQEEPAAEPEGQEAEKPAEEESKPAEAKKDTAKEEAYIAEYARKSGLSVTDAKEEVERNRAILAKYGNDPIEVAKAYRLTQSAFDKLKTQSEQTQKQSIDPVAAQIMANPKVYVESVIKANAPKLIEEFREENPARSASLTDEAILEELRDRGVAQVTSTLQGHQMKLKNDASVKREELISSITELDRQFLPEIRDVLNKLPDHQVVSPNFKFEDLTRWARGNHTEKLVKDAEERGYKRGLEKAKILGEVGQSSPAAKVKQKQSVAAETGLSNYQREQAKQMFGNAYDNEADMFKAYIEVTKRDKKK